MIEDFNIPATRDMGELLDSLYPSGNNARMPPGSKLALAIRHVHFENCGTLEDVLLERGFTIRYVDAGHQCLQDIDLYAADLLISLGGLTPTLGMCFGAQLVARALGSRVYPARTRELGWKPRSGPAAGLRSGWAASDRPRGPTPQ
jgi:hypothetical protein